MQEELVVLLPAIGYDPSCWELQVAALRKKKYNVLTIEYDVKPPAENLFTTLADQVALAIRAAEYSRAHIVGISIGGFVALEVFRRHTALVRSITLAATCCGVGPQPGKLSWFNEYFDRVGLAAFSEVLILP